ncbi:MAG: ABC transporter permease [Planctomycetota bacterium]
MLSLEPWFNPRFCVPLAGMIFGNAMNSVSLSAERLVAEQAASVGYAAARQTAMRAAMIPAINGMLAVGLVTIPGMMTGQVLSGVDPLIAARYQIMVMAMVFSSAGLSAGVFLSLQRPDAENPPAAAGAR